MRSILKNEQVGMMDNWRGSHWGKAIAIVGIVCLLNCRYPPTTSCFPGKSFPFNKITLSPSKYLPHDFLEPDDLERNKNQDRRHAAQLTSLQEPSLLTDTKPGEETYRFYWGRSFHEPIALRISSLGQERTLVIKMSDGKGGYEPGKLVVSETKSITEEEWKKFLALLEDSCFWGMTRWNNNPGIDGAGWLLEGVKDGRYHLVLRWTPQGGDFQRALLYLLELSKLNPKEIY